MLNPKKFLPQKKKFFSILSGGECSPLSPPLRDWSPLLHNFMKRNNAWLVLSKPFAFRKSWWSVELPKITTVKRKAPQALLPIRDKNIEII